MNEIDIWGTANFLIKQHGKDAAFRAAQRADKLLADGAVTGALVWCRVLKAIEELQLRWIKFTGG